MRSFEAPPLELFQSSQNVLFVEKNCTSDFDRGYHPALNPIIERSFGDRDLLQQLVFSAEYTRYWFVVSGFVFHNDSNIQITTHSLVLTDFFGRIVGHPKVRFTAFSRVCLRLLADFCGSSVNEKL